MKDSAKDSLDASAMAELIAEAQEKVATKTSEPESALGPMGPILNQSTVTSEETQPAIIDQIEEILTHRTNKMRKALEGSVIPMFDDVEQEEYNGREYPNGVVVILKSNPNQHDYPLDEPLITIRGTHAIRPRTMDTGNHIPRPQDEAVHFGTAQDIKNLIDLLGSYNKETRANILNTIQ